MPAAATPVRRVLVLVVALGLVPALAAQLQFDVASVKENRSGAAGGTFRFVPDGGVRATNMPARSFITIAHGLEPYQLVGLPDWGRDLRYDLDARPAGRVARDESRQMLQALLADRFKVKFHRESRQIDGFAMVRVRQNVLGPSMRPSTVACDGVAPLSDRCRESRVGVDTMRLVGAPLSTLVQMVVSKVGAPIADETGLMGAFDLELVWTDDTVPTDDRRSIYTALQEQLGLRLERRRVTADVFVVDRIERPSPD